MVIRMPMLLVQNINGSIIDDTTKQLIRVSRRRTVTFYGPDVYLGIREEFATGGLGKLCQ